MDSIKRAVGLETKEPDLIEGMCDMSMKNVRHYPLSHYPFSTHSLTPPLTLFHLLQRMIGTGVCAGIGILFMVLSNLVILQPTKVKSYILMV